MKQEQVKVSSFDEVNVILNRLVRKAYMQGRVTGMLSPSILTFSPAQIAEDGLAAQMIAPCAGTISGIAYSLPEVTAKRQCTITVQAEGTKNAVLQKATVTKAKDCVSLSLAIIAGDVISVYLSDVALTSVLLSATFIPDLGQCSAKNYLVSQLEETTQDEGV